MNDFRVPPVELEHALAVRDLPEHPFHRDPFDRLPAAQSLVEGLPQIGRDTAFDGYRVSGLW